MTDPVRTVETPEGPVPVWGRLEGEGPLLFVIRGARPTFDHMLDLAKLFPPAALVHLPGMYTPFFQPGPVGLFSRAFDAVIETLGARRAVVLAVSIGGVAALGMKHPAIERLILVDTPLQTEPLWPLHDAFRAASAGHGRAQQWFADLFGLFPDRVENRDYRPLLEDLAIPTTALIGSDPLGAPRALTRAPGLVTPEDRALYERHPRVRALTVPDTGHNIPGQATAVLLDEVSRALGRG